ncbi:MAG: hypothetical protein JJT90_11820 [Ectothiorhodospiraceae bacterium]|nr:hypothetical protein [Ectothiorhodospiraceae bacterium]
MAAERPLVILHGWNDSGDSFDRLARHLSRELPDVPIERVSVGDYLSMSDALRFDDLQAALDRAWRVRGLPRRRRSVDVIVHSTGGLVIRDWLRRHFDTDRTPIRHLVMLAPANFGSPLAHVGRSMVGRVTKGFIRRQPGQQLFNTGAHILRGLELASPYSWQLAEADRFVAGNGMFAPGRTLCTVLVGNTGYSGIRSVANEEGGDGTVRISTANLDCARIRIDFSQKSAADPDDPDRLVTVPKVVNHALSAGRTAFRILDRIDHSSIKLDSGRGGLSRAQRRTLDLVVRALTVEDDAFEAFCQECDEANAALTRQPGGNQGKPGYQNTVVRVRDQFGEPVTDYMIEFYDPREGQRDGGRLARRMHAEVIRDVHVYKQDASYRSLYIDTNRLQQAVAEAQTQLGLSITASPILGESGVVAGFSTFTDEEIEDLRLDTEDLARFFQPHRTLLVDIVLERLQARSVFRLRAVPPR